MTKGQRELFEAVCADDIKQFDACVKENKANLSVRFGRFPLLSACYLLKSRNIVKKYENNLISLSSYEKTNEPVELYEAFKKYAGKSLRLYGSDGFVSPAEMLALMGESGYLEANYKKLGCSGKTDDSIRNIYRLTHHENVEVKNGVFMFERLRLTKLQTLLMVFVAVITAVAIILSSLFLIVTENAFGKGTEKSPFHISSGSQFMLALKQKTGFFSLDNDIVVDGNGEPLDFEGTIDGNGHTVKVNSDKPQALFGHFTGSIKNVNLEFTAANGTFTENIALLTNENSGTISNVSIRYNAEMTETSANERVYFSCFAYENVGKIENCLLNAQIKVTGNAVGDAFVSGFAALNGGDVNGCVFAEGSKIETDTVDIGGIVAENMADGEIGRAHV
jgi:hypothetical protein